LEGDDIHASNIFSAAKT